jgi:arabinofuranosyltransferase
VTGRLRWLGPCAALALFALGFARFRSELIDDAYISLRYARHLAQGLGLVWNPGEPVEGYTDFLWVILLSLVGATREAAWALGALAGALLLVVMSRVPERLRVTGLAGALLPLAVTAHLAVPYWSAKGLETTLFTLLVTAGLLLHASGAEPRRSLLAVHLLSLSALTRPEGLLFLALAVIDRARRRDDPARVHALLLPILLLGPHLAFRLWYYGFPLPNTYYAKVGGGAEQWLRGLHYLATFFAQPAGLLFLAAGVAAASRRPLRFLAAAVALGCLGIVYVGGDAFGAHRFVMPILPSLCLLTVAGFSELAGRLGRAASGPAAAALTLGLAAALFADSRGPVGAEEQEVRRFTTLMAEAGKALKEQTPDWVTIALNPCGAIPYYSERRAIDMLGLNDVHIAHRAMRTMGSRKAGHEKGDGAYVLSRKPDLILIGNVWIDETRLIEKINPSRRSEIEIMSGTQVFEDYEVVAFPMSGGRFLKALARREGTALPKSGWLPKNYRDIPVPRWQ